MSTRLQVVMDEAELQEIRSAAERRGMNVSTWVRQVLREERERARTGRSVLPAAPVMVRERRPPWGAGEAEPEGHPASQLPLGRVHVEVELKGALLDAVQLRYRLASPRAAIEFALRRVAVVPMSREEALEMEGRGWEGDLDALRSGDPGALW